MVRVKTFLLFSKIFRFYNRSSYSGPGRKRFRGIIIKPYKYNDLILIPPAPLILDDVHQSSLAFWRIMACFFLRFMLVLNRIDTLHGVYRIASQALRVFVGKVIMGIPGTTPLINWRNKR